MFSAFITLEQGELLLLQLPESG